MSTQGLFYALILNIFFTISQLPAMVFHVKHIGEYIGEADPPSFDDWWAVYPRKAAKKKAKVMYEKLTDQEKSACYLGTVRQVEGNPQWQGDDQFIPLPTTFLNQARWEDAIPQTHTQKVASTPIKNEADLVWSAMTQFFGDQWVKRHGPKPTELWVKMLKNVSKERLHRGFRRIYESHAEFPPSLPKFMEFCAKTFDEQHPPALPKPPGDTKKALEAIETMKQMLGVK